MVEQGEKPVGLTKDSGFQVGARRTMDVQLPVAWRVLTSPEGVQIWLGSAPDLVFEKGATYRQADGSNGEVRVFKPRSHLRITWHPPGWPRSSTIQVRVIARDDRTIVAFHQEHLPGPEARSARKTHFLGALDELEQLLTSA